MNQQCASTFGARYTALEVINGQRLDHINAIVTGASSGIGIETARALSAAGARVTIAVRDIGKGQQVANEIKDRTKSAKVHVLHLDLSDFRSVCKFANDYLGFFDRLDVLINNAGIMACPLAYTVDGYESQFATNHLGHFLLTKLLMPALEKAAPSRVVSLSSVGHRRSDVHLEDIHYRKRPYDKWEAYGQSKTANVQFAVGLTNIYKDRGVTSNAVMPGGIYTGLQKYIPVEERRALGWLDFDDKPPEVFKSVEQGAATSIWAAVAAELEGVGGLYLEDCTVAKPWSEAKPLKGYLPYALDPEKAAKLWEVSEFMLDKYLRDR